MSLLQLGHDRQHLNGRACHVVEYSYLADAKPVLRLTEPAKPLDAASARLFRFVPQVRLKSSQYVGSNVRTKRLKVFDGFGGQNNIERHFG